MTEKKDNGNVNNKIKPVPLNTSKREDSKTDLQNEIILERYKFILNEITNLNCNVNKYINIFQLISTAIIGGGVAVFLSWKSLGFAAINAIKLIEALKNLLIVITLFFIALIIVSIFSWFDFRNEETDLVNRYFKDDLPPLFVPLSLLVQPAEIG